MKKILFIIGAMTLMLAGFAGQSSAGVDVHIGLFGPAPVYAAPVYERHVVVEEPIYYRAPVYRHYERERWYPRHEYWHHDRDWDYRHDWRRDRYDGYYRDYHRW